jgi:ribosomal protein S18 acetylase RimI-like enzyme
MAGGASVRRAGPADLDAVARLFDLYRQFQKQASDPAGARAFIGERVERGESVIFLAEDANGALGFAQLFPSFSSVGMTRTFTLNDLYVTIEARGRGVATALLDAAAEFADGEGASRLILLVATDNAAAEALYVREGWRREDSFFIYLLPLGKKP